MASVQLRPFLKPTADLSNRNIQQAQNAVSLCFGVATGQKL